MALYSGRLLMRGGNEADFNSDKMLPREWAVSTDKRIVRICVAPGICIRMATYDAFEEDMAKIENILKECQTIQEVVVRINAEVSQNAYAVAEYTEQAKQYRDDAKRYRNEAFMATPSGYEEVVKNVEKNTVKIDTIIDKAYLGIKETVSGEEIHLTDSAKGKAVEFALFGKATQNTTSGKNILPYPYFYTTRTINGIIFTDMGDGSIIANGTATADAYFKLVDIGEIEANNYILSGCPIGGGTDTYNIYTRDIDGNYVRDVGNGVSGTFPISTSSLNIVIKKDVKVENLTFKPMIRLASITDDTYEPYTGGIPSPNPSYPQEIEVSGESYNLLENTATSQTVKGVEFVVNEDRTITVNGITEATPVSLLVNTSANIPDLIIGEKYILSGSPKLENTIVKLVGDDSKSIAESKNGNEVSFVYNGEDILRVEVTIRGVGTKLENLTFYPLFIKECFKNDRYMPYGKGSVEVKSVGKNLLANIYECRSHSGIEFTVNKDGSVSATGTATGTATIFLYGTNGSAEKNIFKNMILSGCPKGGSANGYNLRAQCFDSLEALNGVDYVDNGNGVEIGAKDYVRVYIRIASGTTVSNLTFYPMIRLASDTDDTYEPYKETISIIPTENGLAGIKVDNGGNYTDSNGQQWITDEIVKFADGSGQYIQRVGNIVFDGVNNVAVWVGSATNALGEALWQMNLGNRTIIPNSIFISSKYILCDKFKTFAYVSSKDNIAYGCRQGSDCSICCLLKDEDGVTGVATANAWLQENPVTVYYILKEPITTPLTAEQIAEIEKLSTFYPVTNIFNDSDCGMKVTYLADSKNYIDNKLALQAKAREEEMMSMFLLLPEETQAAMIENDTNNLMLGMEE